MARRIYSLATAAFFLSLCLYGEAGALPVTFSAETFIADAYTSAWDISASPGGTLIEQDFDNPPDSSTPPVSAHAEIPGVVNQVSYSGTADALAQSRHLEMSASAYSGGSDYLVSTYAHAGFVGEFTAATSGIYFTYDISYDLSVSGDNPYAGFSHAWSLWDVTGSTPVMLNNGWEVFDITSGSLSDTTSDEISLSTTVGNQYKFYYDSGPFLDARVTGAGTADASLTADFGFDTEPSSVPEPGTLILLGSGILGLGIARRRLKK